MKSRNKFLLLVVAANLWILGCVGNVVSNVTRFHTLGPAPYNKTFVVLIADKKKENSLETKSYLKFIEKQLILYGMRKIRSREKPDYVVMFDHAISGPKTTLSTMPVFGQTGGGTTSFSGTARSYGYGGSTYFSGTSYTTPTYGIVGSVNVSSTRFTRILTVDIIDLAKSRGKKITKVFEGRVLSTGSAGSFNLVADCLLKAIFKDFPGTSGKTKTYEMIWNKENSKCLN